MSGIFSMVYPLAQAFVYDPADGVTLVTEKIVTLLRGQGPDPTDVAIDENGVLTFPGPNYADGHFTAHPGNVITQTGSEVGSGPLQGLFDQGYLLVAPYDPSL